MTSASLGAGVEVPDFFKLDPPILATIRGLDISRKLASSGVDGSPLRKSIEKRDSFRSAKAFRNSDTTVGYPWSQPLWLIQDSHADIDCWVER